jgi:NhaP-type Na+/H+ or K+/H+ antiporter
MSEWTLAIAAATLLAVAAISRRLSGSWVTPTMLFVAAGVIAGPRVLDEVHAAPSSSVIRALAEATLTVLLFADASRIRLGALRRDHVLPARLLGIGLPLTIAAGAVGAKLLLPQLSVMEAVLLAIVLAPTDAALGQAVVTEPRLPLRIRQGLNVESGLNDGICVPLLFIVLATAEVDADAATSSHAATIVLEEIGYGIAGGLVAGVLAAAVVVFCRRRGLMSDASLPVVPVVAAGLAYGVANPLGGSGFIAAFVGGLCFGALARDQSSLLAGFNEQLGDLLNSITFLAFGAVLLGPSLDDVDWRVVLYAVASLTVVRMVPVALALLGSGARRETVAFVGWFGPRGLASIVFAVLIIEEAQLPHVGTMVLTTYVTVGLSVLVHGMTAAPLTRRYARWYEAHPRDARPPMEGAPAVEHRARGVAGA